MRISLCQAGDMQESSVSQGCSRFCAEEDVIANQGVFPSGRHCAFTLKIVWEDVLDVGQCPFSEIPSTKCGEVESF